MKCPYCSNEIPAGAANCPSCGAAAPQPPPQPQPQQRQYQQAPQVIIQQSAPQCPVEQKSSFVAGLLSCLIVGLGQMYNGQVAKGVVLLVSAILIGSFTFGVGSLALWIVGIIDACAIANKINAGRKVGDWEFF